MGRPDVSGPMPEGLEDFQDEMMQWIADSAELLLNVSPEGFMTWLRIDPVQYTLMWSVQETKHPDGSRTVDVVADDMEPPEHWQTLFSLLLYPVDAGKTLLKGYFVDGPPDAHACYIRLLSDAKRLFGPNSDGVNYLPVALDGRNLGYYAPDGAHPEPATPPPPPPADAPAEAPAPKTAPPDSGPWDAIPVGWEREAVRYWLTTDMTWKAIAGRVAVSHSRVLSRMSELRQSHPEVIPTDAERKGRHTRHTDAA